MLARPRRVASGVLEPRMWYFSKSATTSGLSASRSAAVRFAEARKAVKALRGKSQRARQGQARMCEGPKPGVGMSGSTVRIIRYVLARMSWHEGASTQNPGHTSAHASLGSRAVVFAALLRYEVRLARATAAFMVVRSARLLIRSMMLL